MTAYTSESMLATRYARTSMLFATIAPPDSAAAVDGSAPRQGRTVPFAPGRIMEEFRLARFLDGDAVFGSIYHLLSDDCIIL